MPATDTGMYRKIDVLGRIVIPAEIRKSLDLKVGGVLDISLLNGSQMLLSPRRDQCTFCGLDEGLIWHKEKRVCKPCRDELSFS